jgi:hypothetical protein
MCSTGGVAQALARPAGDASRSAEGRTCRLREGGGGEKRPVRR